MSAAVLSARAISLSYGSEKILDESSLVVHEGDRLGLLGRNGCGKSTFLKIIAGVNPPDSGEVIRRRDLVTGYLPQVFDLDENRTVHANILDGATRILQWIAEYETAPPDSARSAELLGHIDHADGWDLEHRIKSLMSHLHTPEPDRLVSGLSGGEKRRVALCRALLEQPDFLILDEPTNHLDTESITWLEDFLRRYPGACLFVTHDRYFLDRVATRIVELTRGKFIAYEGNYTDYLAARAERVASEDLQEHKRQRFLQRELEWVRRGPKARRTKSRDRIDRYYQIAADKGPEQEMDVELLIPPAPKLANRVVDLLDVTATVPGGRTLFSGLTFKLAAKERIGIVGRNGLGKTTLLRLILGEMAPAAGTVEIGARTEINYVDQSKLMLDDEKTVWQEVGQGSEWVKLGEESVTLRAWLRRFLFTEERLNTKVRLLSGGERSRVMLAKILRRGGNLLILDEPTNDLDLATLRVLEEALATFGGSVLAVSHDRYFLNRICTGILAFEGEGKVRYCPGNYDYYLDLRERDALPDVPAAPVEPAKTATAPASKGRKLKWKEERELETIEADILAAETEVTRLEAAFATSDFYEKHRNDWHTQEALLESAKHKVARLYARWTELEGIKAGK
jgi:ATP-binding cassette subfamily F protein uup